MKKMNGESPKTSTFLTPSHVERNRRVTLEVSQQPKRSLAQVTAQVQQLKRERSRQN